MSQLLKLLLLAGEAVGPDIFNTWFGKVRLINGWGPAETCCFSTLHEWKSSTNESPLTIGRPVAGFCWIVGPNDPERLAPIGTVGEVVIQGPTLLREYLASHQTEATTVRVLPKWAPRRSAADWDRFYKSGDLCVYNFDGTIRFASRKDTQVKIRGLRVELSEVEYHIRECLTGVQQAVVDLFKTEAGLSLAAYFSFTVDTWTANKSHPNEDTKLNGGAYSGEGADNNLFLPLTAELQAGLTALVGQLNIRLPRYMIPTCFIPCRYMPVITSTKIDRQMLRSLTQDLNQNEIATYSLVNREKHAPETPMELKLQKLWAEVLRVMPDLIGRDDSFLQIGGDSILAISLVSKAREVGLSLTVKNIFDDPRLSAVAAATSEIEGDEGSWVQIKPWSLLPPHIDRSTSVPQILEQCGLDNHDHHRIEDVYPCTKLQEGLMALAVKQPGSYVAQYMFRIPSHVSLDHFKSAWDQTVQACTNLRTRIVLVDGYPLQVLVRDDVQWEPTDDLNVRSVLRATSNAEIAYGSRLSRYALVQESDGKNYFVLIIHHTVYDGWTMRITLEMLHRIYHDVEVPALQPYNRFVKYIMDIDPEAASKFWKEELCEAKRASFPPIRWGSITRTRLVKQTIDFPQSTENSITKATILRAAWAMLLALYCGSDDICFGTTVSGRNAPVPGIEKMVGPAIATVPVRVQLDYQKSVLRYLEDIQCQALEMVSYEQYGLQNISKISTDAKEACDFSSLLVIQPMHMFGDSEGGTESASRSQVLAATDVNEYAEGGSLEGYFNYPLVMQCLIHGDQVVLHLTYDSNILGEGHVTALYHQFEHLVQQLVKQDETPLSEISAAGEWDLQQAVAYSNEDPDIVNSCVHHLVEAQAELRPNAIAIQAWDATMTFRELDGLSNQLAHHLINEFSVVPDNLIHVCFEKSAWFFVAILAINKAGGAWIPLDPSHPEQRQRHIVQQTQATLALASPANIALCSRLVPNVVEVSPGLNARLASEAPGLHLKPPASNVTPDNVAYVLFTSGSTGTPKGLIMEHRAVCTSQTAISKRLQFTPDVRMLQFAAFVFDLCIGEIIATLISGACLCVLSEQVRMNRLKEFIRETGINWAFLTPSFVRTLRPEDVPSLKLLLLAGEAVGRDILDSWFGKLRLVNGWGPAETCCFSTLYEWESVNESPLLVGRPVGGFCWIVSQDNPQKLASIGTVGEVVIQGPTLLREYLMNHQQTEATCMTTLPSWAPRRSLPNWNRFYKSGDLCSYNQDGSIQFCSRKDTQVKIRGLRVELSEVEHHVRESLEGVQQTVVDVFKTEGSTSLVAYFTFDNDTDDLRPGANGQQVFLPITADLQNRLAAAIGQLTVKLPRYMLPTIWIPCQYMPVITSTKIDRNKLRSLTNNLEAESIAMYSLIDTKKRTPETQTERRLQKLWANILNKPTEFIGRDDNFLRLGGDSLSAISLVSKARDAGLRLTVKDIFNDPRLSAVAAVTADVHEATDQALTDIKPFSLLPTGLTLGAIESEIRDQCSVPPDTAIEDVYCCTGFQEGLMALAVKHPNTYTARYLYRLPETIDISRFKAAWEQTVDACSNLRTRIVHVEGHSIQVMLKDDIAWEDTSGLSLTSALNATKDIEMQYGTRLCRYALVQNGKEHYFIWTVHHAIYDGWTKPMALNILTSSYHGGTIPALLPYKVFVNYTSAIDDKAVNEYWRAQLRGAKRTIFPPRGRNTTSSGHILMKTIPLPNMVNSAITKATVLRAAWAVVLARYCGTDDICFGITVSGRQAPIPGIETIAGSTLATMPVRVRLDPDRSVSSFLLNVQHQASEMVNYEQYGLQKIAQVSSDAGAACDFGSLLVVQPAQQIFSADNRPDALMIPDSFQKHSGTEPMRDYFNYPLVLEPFILKDRLIVRMIYDSHVLKEAQLTALSEQFGHVAEQLAACQEDMKLGSVTVVSPSELRRSAEWNDLPPGVNACTHWQIDEQVRTRPNDPAVCAWDRSLSYAELDALASRLALRLQELGVGPEVLVPLCFPKSAWAVVAMVAVQKAGGAFVPLDPAAPPARLRSIITNCNTQLAICAPAVERILQPLGINIFPLDEYIVSGLPIPTGPILCPTEPQNASFLLFTSGSTAEPKGIVMQHDSACSTAAAYGSALHIGPMTRVLQFSAYTFDVGVWDVLITLTRGGCVCVPSDDARLHDLAGALNDMEANWAFLTPTVADILNPADVPGLKTLCLGGEPVRKGSADRWQGVELHGIYGPAEAAFCGWNAGLDNLVSAANIGRPLSSAFWVVDPENPKQLVPVGCVGELLLQGPMLARGYLNGGEDIAASNNWIENVDWIPNASPRRGYLTGDLVRSNNDGSFDFIGRKDSQIKLHGQRIELGEIECRLHECLPHEMSGVVDLVEAPEGQLKTLTAFLWYTGGPSYRKGKVQLVPSTEESRHLIYHLESSLRGALPSYMIPTVFMVLQGEPGHTTSGKIDRRELLEFGKAVPAIERSRCTLSSETHEPPSTSMELKLRELWADVLNIPAEDIGKNDDFLRIGGDSVTAIRLVMLARRHGIQLTVQAIFNNPRLSAMASSAVDA